MNFEDFQLIDNEPFGNSIIKRDYLKIYHQQGANLNDPDQNVEFIFGENNNYHQNGNSYLEIDITVRDLAANFDNTIQIGLIKDTYADCFKEASLATTGGIEIEHVKLLGQFLTNMRPLTGKDGDLLSHFDNTNEGNTAADFKSTSVKQMFTDNHTG